MKKLLIATENFLPRWDGVARFLSEVIPRVKNDFDITVIAPDFKGNIKDPEKVKVIRIPLFSLFIGDIHPAKFKIGTIRKQCKEADIIWIQSIGPIGGLAILLGHFYKKPVIAYYHSIEWELATKSTDTKEFIKKILHWMTKWIARRLYNRCDIIMAPSREVAEILTWQKINTKKVIVQLGVNVKRFLPPEDKIKAKERLGIDINTLVVGFVGRIGREKDLKTLYRGFSRVQNKVKKKVILLLIGKGVKELEDLFGSKKNVKLIGSKDNVVPYLQAMDVYVLSSLTETTSLSTMEAMSCGIPVITTPVGLTKQYIKEGYNGMFFPKEDPFTLTKKLEKLLNDKNLRKKLGENGRATILHLFSWDKTIEKIRKVLESY
jgi:1,2-diacylglycerol 3-alpha-glucosyltransferase